MYREVVFQMCGTLSYIESPAHFMTGRGQVQINEKETEFWMLIRSHIEERYMSKRRYIDDRVQLLQEYYKIIKSL